jgi:hypothetical protein
MIAHLPVRYVPVFDRFAGDSPLEEAGFEPLHGTLRIYGFGGLRFLVLLGGFGEPAVQLKDVLAREGHFIPIEKLCG